MEETGIVTAAGLLPAIVTFVAIAKPSLAVPFLLTVYLGF